MDPITISTTVFACLKVVCTCSTTLYAFMDDVAIVDESVMLLHDEINALQRSIVSVDTSLRSPSLQKHEGLTLWRDINEAMLECQRTITALEERIADICPAPQKRSFWKATTLQMKLNYRADEMARLRAQVQSHQSAMQTILQMINVHISSSAPDVVLDELNPQLQKLLRMVSELHQSAFATDLGNAKLKESHEKLEQSAKVVASKASTVIGSRSTAWSGSQPDLKKLYVDETEHSRPGKRSTTTGSELGEPLSPEARKRISTWVSLNPEMDSTVPPIPHHPLLATQKVPNGSGDSQVTLEGPHVIESYHSEGEEDSSDDDELEVEVAQKYLSEGSARTEAGNHAQAEAFLRKGLDKAVLLGSKLSGVHLADVRLDIAIACYEQDKLADAVSLVDELMRLPSSNDEDRRRVLAASYLRAQVLLRQGLHDDALRQCKRTVNGRKRLGGKDRSYFESVCLMATIYAMRGDEIEAVTYAGLLPADFERPIFKQPDTSLLLPQQPAEGRPIRLSPFASVETLASKATSHAVSRETLVATPSHEVPGHDLEVESVISSDPSVSHTASTRNDSLASTEFTVYTTSNDGEPAALQPPPLKIRPRSPSADTISTSVSKESFVAAAESTGTPPSERVVSRVGSVPEIKEFTVEDASPRRWAQRSQSDNPALGTAVRTLSKQISHSTISTLSSIDEAPLPPNVAQLRTALPSLTVRARSEAVKLLEQTGSSLTVSRDWSNEMFWAAAEGHAPVVQLLLTDWQYQKPSRVRALRPREITSHKAVPVDIVDNHGRTALHLSSINGRAKVVQTLLGLGASYTMRMEAEGHKTQSGRLTAGRTALECAIAEGHRETAYSFVGLGCFDNSTDHHGWSLLHQAAFSGDRELFRKLLDSRLNSEAKTDAGRTPLHIAAQKGKGDVVELLLARGATHDSSDHCGSTPLSLAVAGGHRYSVNLLLAAGADVRVVDFFNASVMHIAARAGHAILLPSLLARDADLNACDEKMRTPLHYAAQAGQHIALRKLLDLGADSHAQDDEGNTPLHTAAECGHKAVIDVLLNAGLDVNQSNNSGKTAVTLAASNGHRVALLAMLPDCTSINMQDRTGSTALSHAKANGYSLIAKLLELNGAKG